MMESINTDDSNQHVNIIIRLLEEDNTLSNIIIPLQNKNLTTNWVCCKIKLKFNLKKCLFSLFLIGYIAFLYYSLQILFFKKIHFKNNIWFVSLIMTCNDLISILIILFHSYKKWRHIYYITSLSIGIGIILIGCGLYEFFHVTSFVLSPLFTLFCILLLTNISFYSSFITWIIFHISS
jgi:hypothetical protein